MIKATIVLLAAHLVIPRLNRRSAAERHALWIAAIAIAAALPVLTWLLPSWEPAWAQWAADTWPAAFESSSPAFSAGDIVVRATGIDSGRWTIVSIAPTLWVAVSILLLLRLAMQALQLTRLTSSGIPSGSRLAAIGRTVADALSLPPPRVTCSERVSIPLAWGVRRARVLLPPASHAWPDERVWAVCAHELAHISRGDWIVHLLAEIACRIYWFNPLLWLARNRLSRESERAADDCVIGLGASGADYASHLIEILRGARPDLNPTPAVGMVRLRTTRFGEAGRESGFERRIAALVNALVNRTRLSRNWAMAILAGACILAAPLATLNARGRSTIEIRTSNLPPIVDSAVRELASDGSDPVREIRVVNRATTQDVAPSVAEYTTPPLYSDDARRGGVEGVVVALARIDVNGHVDAARVVRGLGFGLDQNALVALRQWRFHPGIRNGVATPMDVEIEIGFTLRNESINAQIANDMVSLVGPGVTPPQAVKVENVRPLRATPAGTVVLDVVLLENGTPRIVRIIRSLGADADDMAVRTFEQWRFSPALKDGRPIKVRMNAEVRFHG
jgi:bla regulator protein BlaR1